MPTIQRETTIAANAVDQNIIAGSAYEFMRANGVISAGVVAAATGLFLTVQAGPDVVLEESPVQIQAAGWPVQPDTMYYNFGAAQADRIVFRVRNSTGAGIIARSLLQITYV
jgi:hypothetical protein